jgi:autotransporter-associated beta strand protein
MVTMGTSASMVFTIRNTGDLELTNLVTSVDGENSGDFTIGSLGVPTLTPGVSTTFSVTFTPSTSGTRVATLHISSNDPSTNPFNISLTGTGAVPPAVSASSNAITSTTATLSGTVNPNGLATTAQFEYGTTIAYGSIATVTLLPDNGSTAQNVSANLTGLVANTIYHFRLSATSAAGTTTGEDGVFVTESTSGDFKYTVAGSTVTITGYTGAGGAVSIPGLVNGLPVTAIGSSAFLGKTAITSVVIPNGVTSIGGNAFLYCSGINSAFFVGSAPTMDSFVFYGTATGFTLYYTTGKSGFTSPTWQSYPAVALSSDPGIITHPASVTITSGSTATLTIAAIGTEPLTYQWYQGATGTTTTPVGTNSASFTTPALTATTSYWAKVTNAANPTGADSNTATVTVQPRPLVTTGAATWATSATTTLTGTVNPNGLATTAQFEYGPTTAYGSIKTVTLSPNNGSTDLIVSANLGSLPAGTTYHYRLTATNVGGAINGDDHIFITERVSGDYKFTTADGTVTITDYTGAGGAVTIPETLSGLTVTGIGYGAFRNKSGLTGVIFPTSVTSIGDRAFDSCYWLTSVTLTASLTSIGSNAFSQCTGLTSVILPGSVTSIGSNAFYYCTGLTSVTIPANVTSIGSNAFYYCTGLTAITVDAASASYSSLDGVLFSKALTTLIQYPVRKVGDYSLPASVTSIASNAFFSCAWLTSVTLPANVTSIGSQAFYYCTGLTAIMVDAASASYSSLDGVLFNKALTTLVLYPGGKAGAYTLPGSVTSIGDYAFYYCTGLTSISLPASVTSIGKTAFFSCTGLTSVTIPGSVTSIGDYAFYYCTGLTAITVDAANASYSSLDGVLFDKTRTTLIQFPGGKAGAYTLPASVTSIGDYAFYCCTGLTSLTLPASVTSIGDAAFFACLGLTSVTFPASVTSIGIQAFYNCSGLKTALFLGNAPTMGWSVFTSTATGFSVYYLTGKSGFTSPTWPGYPAVATSDPGFITQPASVTITSGSTATLAVTAISTEPLTYQWYQGATGTTTTPVGTNSASFTTPALTATTSYWAKVTNAANPTGMNSYTAKVTVQAVPTFYWDGNMASANSTSDNSSTAAMNWLSGGKWDNGTTSAARSVWSIGDTAVFGGTTVGQTITLGSPITVGGITFDAANYLLSGSIINLSGSSTTVAANQNATIASVIAGTGALVKSGLGTLALTNANTYPGGTVINDGTLQMGAGGTTGSVGSGGIAIGGGGTFRLLRTEVNLPIPNVLSGAGTLAVAGTGVIEQSAYVLSAASPAFVGSVVIDDARLGITGSLGNASIKVLDGGQVWYNVAANFSNPLEITGNGWNETAGMLGAIRLSLGASFSGAITLKGDSRITSLGSTGSITGTISESGGSRALEVSNYATYANSTITLSGSSNHSGGTTVKGAVVVVRSNQSVGSGPVTVVSNGTAARVTRLQLEGVVIDNDITLASSAQTDYTGALYAAGGGLSIVNGDVSVTAAVGNGGHLAAEKNTNAVLRVMGAIKSLANVIVRLGVVELGGGGNYPSMSVAEGTLRLAANDGVNSGAILTLGTSSTAATGTLDLNGFQQTVAGLTKGPQPTTVINNGTLPSVLTLNIAAGQSEYAGSIGGGTHPIALAKTGLGSFILSGANTYSGSTSIDRGSLILKTGGSINNSSGVAIAAGALFDITQTGFTLGSGKVLSGSGTVSGSLTAATGAIITPGTDSAGTLSVGSLNLSAGAILNLLPGETQLGVTAINGLNPGGGANSVTIHLGTSPLPVGTYHLIAYNGSISGSGFSAFKLGTTPSGLICILRNTPSFVDVEVAPLVPPTVTSGSASGITASAATLSGTVNPNGLATTARFEYGMTTAYGSTASVTISPNDGSTAQNVSVSISGLQPDTIYHYRLTATSGGGTSPGADLTFTTYPTLPYTYTTTSGSVTLTGYSGTGGDVTVPATINGLPVIAIGANAFQKITSLARMTLPASLTSIGNYAFSGCTNLASVTIPAGVSSIGVNAFFGCASLTAITIPASVTSIGGNALSGCTKMVAITVDAGNSAYSSVDGVLCNKSQSMLIKCPGGKAGSYAIPNSVTSIADSAFASCWSLTSVTMSNNVISIAGSAFYDCTNLTSATISSSLTIIADFVFGRCSSLTGVTIPNSVTRIGNYAFRDCGKLTSVILGTSVTSIGVVAFFNCTSLTSITIPNSVTSIGNNAFNHCILLGSVILGTSVTSIESQAFLNCTSLTSVNIPASVASIGDRAFSGCTALKKTSFTGNAPTMGMDVFTNAASGFTVYYFGSATGFSGPPWDGYATVNMGAATPAAMWLVEKALPYNANLQDEPNGDGVSLLMAYALNLDPNQNLSGSMPKPVIDENRLKLAFFAGNAAVIYAVETSTDLLHWTTQGVSVSGPDANQVRTASVDMNGSQRYMRLVVAH